MLLPGFPLSVPCKSFIFVQILIIVQFNNIPDFLDQDQVETSLVGFVHEHTYRIEKLVYNFVSKEELHKMNQEFLNHDTHTDIITFDYTIKKALRAEFFISMWAVVRSAKSHSQSTENEVLRVISHGVLHCMGQNDKNREGKEQMRKSENRFIKMFHVKQKSHV